MGVMPGRLTATVAGSHGLVVFDLPITTGVVTCELLMPAALAGVAEVSLDHASHFEPQLGRSDHWPEAA
jgi:hypothetical protein